MYNKKENKQEFWEMCMFKFYPEKFKIKYREVKRDSIKEIDSFLELVNEDESYLSLIGRE
jgi:CTP:phosphocholine cytidylyltransferase-like protein